MGLRSLLALGIGVIGCGAGRSYVTVSDARGNVSFSPDGASVVVPSLPRVYGYDLDKKAIRWEHVAKQHTVGVAFAPRGTHVLVVESEEAEPRGFALTLLRADGSRVFDKQVAHLPDAGNSSWFVDHARELFAVSDDGAFVACAVYESLVVFATADGARAHTDSIGRHLTAVAFEPGTHRLVLGDDSTRRLRVVEGAGGAWNTVETLDGAFDPIWTAAGLVFASPKGLELWDGKSRRVVLAADQAFPDGKPSPAGNAPVWAASSDGVYLASWNQARVNVWKVSDAGKAPLFTHDEPSITSGRRVWLVAFAPGHFRVFTEGGDFIDLEIPTGKLLRRTSFGRLGSSSKALFTDGVTHTTSYHRGLSPRGRFVAINTPEDGTKIYLVE